MEQSVAFVKQNSLDCYGWEDQNMVVIISKVTDIVKDKVALFQVYNVEKQEYGVVSNDQIEDYDSCIMGMKPLADENDTVIGSGEEIKVYKNRKKMN